MAFNPFTEKGLPIEKQSMSWSKLNSKPYDKESVHPYTRTRGILMNGIEVEGAIFSHQFARHTDDMDLRRRLALTRRMEQAQQKAINWMIPAEESNLEVTIGYEQVAVDLTAFLARNEPDPKVKAALDFALLEDFDHLYRYANLMKTDMGKEASDITREYTEITVGRPTILEHRHPFDDVRSPIDARKADPRTLLHIMTIIAAEQQTMNFYMNVGDRYPNMVGRGLYLEIGQVEEQHVTHYESLMDPTSTWFEMLLLHEYNECWLYHSLAQDEPLAAARQTWERHLEMEVEHLKIARELLMKHEKKEAEALVPGPFPHLFKFESNIDYVRKILETQVQLNARETEYVPTSRLPRSFRYFKHQEMVNGNGNGWVPSEIVIDEITKAEGTDYRQELAGPHPVEEYRQKEAAQRQRGGERRRGAAAGRTRSGRKAPSGPQPERGRETRPRAGMRAKKR